MKTKLFFILFLLNYFSLEQLKCQESWNLSVNGFDTSVFPSDFTVVENGDVYVVCSFFNSELGGFVPSLYKSTDQGDNWTEISTSGLSTFGNPHTLASSGNTMLLGGANFDSSTGSAIYISNDNGVTWTLSVNGFDTSVFPSSFTVLENGDIYVVCSFFDSELGGFVPSLYKSTDQGDNWTEISTSGLSTFGNPHTLASSGNTMLLGGANFDSSTGSAIYISNDNGVTWTLSVNGFDTSVFPSSFTVLENGDIYVVCSFFDSELGGFVPSLYKSTDQGDNWTEISTSGLSTFGNPHTLASSGNTMLLGGANFDSSTGSAIYTSSVESITKIITLTGDLSFGDVEVNDTQTAILTIANSGNSTLTISNISFPDGFSGDFTSGTIDAGQSQQVTITFAPTAEQEYSGTITVTSDATSGTNTIAASGTGIITPTKIISLNGDLSFGDVEVNDTQTAILTIANSGNSTLTISNISFPDGFSGDFTSGTIDAGQSQQVTITFAPTAEQEYSGTITVTSDATSGTNTIAASGTGIITPTKIISLNGDLSFGDVEVNDTQTAILTIANSGNSTLTISNISFPDGFSGDFTSGTIDAGQSQQVTITFAPTAEQEYSGTITVTSDATSGTNTIAASGTGIITPTKIISLNGDLSFGDVEVNDTQTAILNIANSGNSTLTISNISFPDGFSGDFTSGTIDAGQSQQVTITFAPTAEQEYSGTITVTSDATSGTNTIAASGTGIITPTKIISLNGDLSFGDVEVNDTQTAILNIANSGNSTLTISNISFPDGFSGDFTSGTIDAGQSQQVTITFAPTAEQEYSGTITVTSDATSGTNTIVVSGTGVNITSIRSSESVFGLIEIYPNPVIANNLNIKSNINSIEKITILNSVGSVIFEKEVLTKQTVVSFQGYRKGLYILVLSKGDYISTQKIIVK